MSDLMAIEVPGLEVHRDRLAEGGGASATLERNGGVSAIVIRDRTGSVVVEFDPARGRTILHPGGELEIRVPGSLTLESGERMKLSAVEGIELQTPSDVRVSADRIQMTSRDTAVVSRTVKLHADTALMSIGKLSSIVRELELRCDRLVTRARETFTAVQEVMRYQAGHVQGRIAGGWDVWSGSSSLRSRKRFRINGEKIHLG